SSVGAVGALGADLLDAVLGVRRRLHLEGDEPPGGLLLLLDGVHHGGVDLDALDGLVEAAAVAHQRLRVEGVLQDTRLPLARVDLGVAGAGHEDAGEDGVRGAAHRVVFRSVGQAAARSARASRLSKYRSSATVRIAVMRRTAAVCQSAMAPAPSPNGMGMVAS